MSQERTFVLPLKNNQNIEIRFTPIAATDGQLWQMFATTEALDTVQQLIELANATESDLEVQPQTKSAKKVTPNLARASAITKSDKK